MKTYAENVSMNILLILMIKEKMDKQYIKKVLTGITAMVMGVLLMFIFKNMVTSIVVGIITIIVVHIFVSNQKIQLEQDKKKEK